MSEDKEDRTIAIDALATRGFEPDLFKLAISLHGVRSERRFCVDAYNVDLAKVKEALMSAGIKPDKIKNSEFEVIEHYDWLYEKVDDVHDYYRRVSRLVEGYEYSGDCTVEHRLDRKLLNRIWCALREVDSSISFEIDYRLERPDECEKAILREAVAEARSRAEALASATGARIGNVVSVRYSFDNARPICFSRGSCAPCAVPEELGEISAPGFNPEPIEVQCSVFIAWSID